MPLDRPHLQTNLHTLSPDHTQHITPSAYSWMINGSMSLLYNHFLPVHAHHTVAHTLTLANSYRKTHTHVLNVVLYPPYPAATGQDDGLASLVQMLCTPKCFVTMTPNYVCTEQLLHKVPKCLSVRPLVEGNLLRTPYYEAWKFLNLHDNLLQ